MLLRGALKAFSKEKQFRASHREGDNIGKDKTTNILYGVGLIGTIMVLIGGTYIIISGIVWHGTEMTPFDRVLLAVGAVLASLGPLGIYRDTGSYIPIIPFIFSNLYQIIGLLLSPFLHQGYFTPAYLVIWSIWVIGLSFLGYSSYMTRDQIGRIAIIAGILTVIMIFLRIPVAYTIAVNEDLLFYQLRAVLDAILAVAAAIYYTLAIRTGQQDVSDTS